MDYFEYSIGDFIPSEISGNMATDIHHISCKGMGGSKTKDNIENLMALTREEHIEYGDKKQYIDYLLQVHKDFMNKHKNNET
jgi:hypothetical protein